MIRLKLLLVILFLAALAPALPAQNSQIDEFAWQDVWVNANFDTRPPAPWVAERTPSQKFCVLVLLQQQYVRYQWFDSTFFGNGVAHF